MDKLEIDVQVPEYIPVEGLKDPCLSNVPQLEGRFASGFSGLDEVAAAYPFRITSHFLSLIKTPDDPLGRQVIPDKRELVCGIHSMDPLCEEQQSPVDHVIHRYPDRVLFLVSDRCAMYCRYCMRKRMTAGRLQITRSSIQKGLDYIRRTPAVREVLLSGGDPLMLTDRALEKIMEALKELPHVKVLRIHTRIPCAMPHRITEEFSDMLTRFHPLFINIQFNHPDEITDEVSAACALLTDAGISLGSQSVLLKGINDGSEILKSLFNRLLEIRVKPYYIHHPDVVKGTGHFRVSVKRGLDIMKQLQGHISGMAVPRYMIDLPGGGGKIPLAPESVREWKNGMLIMEGFDGRLYKYPEQG